MKKILILSCSTGEGHNSAAKAVQSVLEKEGYACTMADPVAFQSEKMEHLVSALYNNTIRKRPQVFGAVYKLGALYSSSKLPSPVYWANAHYSEALRDYIRKEGFDAVICSHLYGMEAMTALKKKDHFQVPCYGIVTDYTCIPFLKETVMDGFFVPNEETRQELIDSGTPADVVFISGIPVSEAVCSLPTLEDARKVLNIDPGTKVVRVMTGGVGCENMEGLCDELINSSSKKDLFIVLTGNNEKLKNRLDEKYGKNDNFRTVSFTRQVPLYMAAANVLLSKPGGLSSTEAAVANIPIVHIHAIPGCETCNARYFSQNGMSMWAKTNEEAALNAVTLAYDQEMASKMRSTQRKLIPQNGARFIMEKVVGIS